MGDIDMSTKKVKVRASRSYDITIGSSILRNAGEIICKSKPLCKVGIITDDIVDPLYSYTLSEALKSVGYNPVKYVIRNGEKSKNAENFIKITEFLAENSFTRSDLIVALGGGVVGDISGFAASVYLRGIDFVQIPTTFLAAIDSSVGGKTAINLNVGKNLVGAFWQPKAVICDCRTFATLEKEVFAEGIAEAIKYGVILDEQLFSLLAENILEEDIEGVVERCVLIKRDVVEEDEFDRGQRKLLNFGHTIGHSIEKCSHYNITHGQAVAIGMVIEARIAEKIGFTTAKCSERIIEILKKYNLPYRTDFTAQELAQVALTDKKRELDRLDLVLPKRIGQCELYNIDINEIENIINLGLEEGKAWI